MRLERLPGEHALQPGDPVLHQSDAAIDFEIDAIDCPVVEQEEYSMNHIRDRR